VALLALELSTYSLSFFLPNPPLSSPLKTSLPFPLWLFQPPPNYHPNALNILSDVEVQQNSSDVPPISGTKNSLCKAIPGGTVSTMLAHLMGNQLDFSLLESSL